MLLLAQALLYEDFTKISITTSDTAAGGYALVLYNTTKVCLGLTEVCTGDTSQDDCVQRLLDEAPTTAPTPGQRVAARAAAQAAAAHQQHITTIAAAVGASLGTVLLGTAFLLLLLLPKRRRKERETDTERAQAAAAAAAGIIGTHRPGSGGSGGSGGAAAAAPYTVSSSGTSRSSLLQPAAASGPDLSRDVEAGPGACWPAGLDGGPASTDGSSQKAGLSR